MTGKPAPIIVRRVRKKRGSEHHGGSWKIAYADFVTAMMAFFLLMWLVGSTARGDLQGIAEYFRTPLDVALRGGLLPGDKDGGGEGPAQHEEQGKRRRTSREPQPQPVDLQAARQALVRAEREELEALKERVERTIVDNPNLAQYRSQIRLRLTQEGLQIQILDDSSRPMFDTGDASLQQQTRDILHEIGKLLNGVDNAISLAGHTDAARYAAEGRGYSNWELSADRANAARRELVAGGMDGSKVLRVVGLSSSLPLPDTDPLDPANRRISIVVLNDATERAIRGEASPPSISNLQVEVSPSGDLSIDADLAPVLLDPDLASQ